MTTKPNPNPLLCDWKPDAEADFVGPARRVAAKLTELARLAGDTRVPLKLLLLGRPGVGKSALLRYFARAIGADRWHCHLYNGTEVRVEEVGELKQLLRYRDLFGQYRVIRIEEVDRVPVVAQVALLTLLDELPPGTAVVCSSNCQVQDLEERFHSRFQVQSVSPPTDKDIRELLLRLAPALNGRADRIATLAAGNVRQALLDAQTALLGAATPGGQPLLFAA